MVQSLPAHLKPPPLSKDRSKKRSSDSPRGDPCEQRSRSEPTRNGTLARLDAAERQARGTGRQPAFGKESRKSACGSAPGTPHPGRAREARVRPLGIPARLPRLLSWTSPIGSFLRAVVKRHNSVAQNLTLVHQARYDRALSKITYSDLGIPRGPAAPLVGRGHRRLGAARNRAETARSQSGEAWRLKWDRALMLSTSGPG